MVLLLICVFVFLLGFVVLSSLCRWKTPASNSCFTPFCIISDADRPCPVLARQCRKKNLGQPHQLVRQFELSEMVLLDSK